MRTKSLSHCTLRRQLSSVAAALLVGVAAQACDDPFGLQATLKVTTDTSNVFAMSGTPAVLPAGWNAFTGIVSRITADMAFDVAFDLGTGNQVRLIPARLIAGTKPGLGGGTTATQQVGFLTVSGTFEAIGKAPSTGYKRDSVVTVTPGQPVVVEVTSDGCQLSFATTAYAKLVVDSVNTVNRQIFFRATRNPNCGFRSFSPGVPKN